jgi:hypothetical protein
LTDDRRIDISRESNSPLCCEGSWDASLENRRLRHVGNFVYIISRQGEISFSHLNASMFTVPLYRVASKADYEITLLSIQSRLDRELDSPTSLIWANLEALESSYPETFRCRVGLEIARPEETKRVANWIKRELTIKGYKGIKVEVSRTGRYGSFTVSAEKPLMSMSK